MAKKKYDCKGKRQRFVLKYKQKRQDLKQQIKSTTYLEKLALYAKLQNYHATVQLFDCIIDV
jgi:hypothetical protein